ncbi:MAG TPA: hypothetical protein VGI77_13985 [Gaiellaceae bacterium]|jgi:hypothetical protein
MPERVDDRVTAAYRTGTREGLVTALSAEAARNAGFPDFREVLLSFAPFHDAAKALGLDPSEVFDAAAANVPADVAELLRVFGRRTDVSLGVFGWIWDGEAYRFALRGNRA